MKDRTQRGLSIVEAIVAVAILSITALAVNQFLGSTLRSTRSTEVASIRDQLYDFATQAVNPESMFRSMQNPAGGNALLNDCVRPETADECLITSPNPLNTDDKGQKGFFLMTPDAAGGATVVAGPLALPRSYDDNGEPGCAGAECRYQVVSSFWATCSPLANGNIPDTCRAAETIWVRIQVRTLNPGGAARQGSINVSHMPPQGAFENNVSQFAIPIATKDIRLIAESSCALLGTRMTGFDRFGQPICRCATSCSCGPEMANINGESIDTSFGDCGRRNSGDPNNPCECRDSRCDPRTHFMAGLDQDNRAICKPRNSTENCEVIVIQGNGDCGEGRQMVNVEYGECTHSRTGKAGSANWDFTCADDRATCCSNTF